MMSLEKYMPAWVKRIGLVTVFLLFAAGIVFWGGFNWALEESGAGSQITADVAAGWRPNLSPWAKALLAVMMQDVDSNLSGLLLQDLRDATVRTATGARLRQNAKSRRPNGPPPARVTPCTVWTIAGFMQNCIQLRQDSWGPATINPSNYPGLSMH